jgi:hypothetical protein
MSNDSRGKRLRADRPTTALSAASGAAPTPDEQALADVLLHPATWGELLLTNRDGTPRRYRPYQREDLECTATKVVHMDGRAVGKTIDLSTLLLWFVFTHPGKSVLVAAPYQGHLDTIIEEIEFQLGASDLLGACVARSATGAPKIKRKPYFEVTFTNDAKVYFRPGGTIGASFRSLHVDLLLVDEAAWLPEEAWKAVRQCLNAGGTMRIYSTPNGLRDTTYYRITGESDYHHFKWPSWVAPDWSPTREKELLDFYGGRDTPGWQHEVAGEHGQPTWAAFDTALVLAALDENPRYRKVTIQGEHFRDCRDEASVRNRLRDALGQANHRPGATYWVGGDLGYTSDPTELVVFEEDPATQRLTLQLRVHAEHVAYPVISELLALLDNLYSPRGLGVDRGGNGLSVVQELTTLDKYRERYLLGRLVGYDFGASITVGADEHHRPVRKRVKEHMTALINEALAHGRLVLPDNDHEIEDQLCTQTYTLTERGVVYSKGNDHVVDAIRCALIRRAQAVDPHTEPVEIIVSFTPVLTDPIFD